MQLIVDMIPDEALVVRGGKTSQRIYYEALVLIRLVLQESLWNLE